MAHPSPARHRRALLRSVPLLLAALVGLVVISAPHLRGEPERPAAAATTGGSAVTILAFFDPPRSDPRSHDLSGIAWDNATRTLYAISDRNPQIVVLRPSADYRTWTFGDNIAVSIPAMWDAEGLVLKPEGGFFMSNEFGPRVFELDARGQTIAEVPLPAHFAGIRTNLALESLALTPDGRYLFTGNEAALESDGAVATPAQGTTVRIARYDRVARTLVEYAYRTDPVFAPGEGGDRGLVEIVALSEIELLTMERSFVPNVGNNVRIYRVGLAGAVDVSRMDNLGPQTPVLQKTLLVDLAELPDPGFPAPLQPQPAPILDNFEGMALGPVLPDGRQVLFLISDDNSRDTQTPRILVLAVEGIAWAR